MRYKVSWSKPSRRNKWGYFLPEQPPVHEEEFDNIEQAKQRAQKLSLEHPKCEDVAVLDMEGPLDEGDSKIWCVYAYCKGNLVMENPYYFEEISKQQLKP